MVAGSTREGSAAGRQQRNIPFGVCTRNDRGGRGSVSVAHLNIGSPFHDVQGSQDFGVGIDDDAAANAISLPAEAPVGLHDRERRKDGLVDQGRHRRDWRGSGHGFRYSLVYLRRAELLFASAKVPPQKQRQEYPRTMANATHSSKADRRRSSRPHLAHSEGPGAAGSTGVSAGPGSGPGPYGRIAPGRNAASWLANRGAPVPHLESRSTDVCKNPLEITTKVSSKCEYLFNDAPMNC